MRCKSIQTIAQGDAQSESSQSQSSTKHKKVKYEKYLEWNGEHKNRTELNWKGT